MAAVSIGRRCFLRSRNVAPASLRCLSATKIPEDPPWKVIDQKIKSDSRETRSLLLPWMSVAICAIGAGTLLFFLKSKQEDIERRSIAQKPVSMGKAAIGGPFKLNAKDGSEVTNESFAGKWVLLYFGFTNCPDICPEELEKMSTVHEAVKKSGYLSVPVFVSVDPTRDTPEKVAQYLSEFHTDFVGLTGSIEEITKVVKTFRVYFNKGPADKDGDYIVDHSIICYLLNPAGQFVDYYGQNKTASEMIRSVKTHISYGSGMSNSS